MTVKLAEPVAVGVPEKTPEEDSDSPAGSAPVWLQDSGARPPVAESEAL
jgi:hypothetical protein